MSSNIGPAREIYSAVTSSTKAQVSEYVGTVRGIYYLNGAAAVAYLQIFKLLAASVTVGTTVPDMVLEFPASAAAVMDIPFDWMGPMTIASTTTRGGSTTSAGDVNIFHL